MVPCLVPPTVSTSDARPNEGLGDVQDYYTKTTQPNSKQQPMASAQRLCGCAVLADTHSPIHIEFQSVHNLHNALPPIAIKATTPLKKMKIHAIPKQIPDLGASKMTYKM